MNILKKTFLFAMPAMIAGCGQKARYVITDKAAEKIVYNQVEPVIDTTRHVMVFAPEDMELYKCLAIGDTIDGSDSIARMVAPAAYSHGRTGRSGVINNVNGVDVNSFIRYRKEAKMRDVLIREMNTRRR